MKICVASTPIFKMPVIGYSGLEHLAYLQAKGLAEKGHEVWLVGPDGSECPGVTIIPCGPERQVDEHKAFQTYWQHLLQMDVVIDNTWQKWSYTIKQEGVLKAPILGVMHAPVNTMYQTLPPGVDKPCFVCISQDQANHFEALHGRPARVCYNGVDGEIYKSLGIPRTDRFLFLARFSSIKGADLAIRACREAGVGLDLVGDTSITNEPDYLRMCQSMTDGKQIRIVGPCSRGETVWWYSQANWMIHPNQRFREPFGLAPVEAMSCGCGVIAWNYGAMRETIPHGENGFVNDTPGYLVDSYEQLVKVIRSVAGAKQYPSQQENLRRWASKFSVDHMVSRYEELCKEVIEGGW